MDTCPNTSVIAFASAAASLPLATRLVPSMASIAGEANRGSYGNASIRTKGPANTSMTGGAAVSASLTFGPIRGLPASEGATTLAGGRDIPFTAKPEGGLERTSCTSSN